MEQRVPPGGTVLSAVAYVDNARRWARLLEEDEAAKAPRPESNILLELEEETAAPRSNGDWMERRTQLLEGLLQARPGVKSVEERLAMFKLMAPADPSAGRSGRWHPACPPGSKTTDRPDRRGSGTAARLTPHPSTPGR